MSVNVQDPPVLLSEILVSRIPRFSDRVAAKDDTMEYTYSRLDAESNILANALSAAGVERGDRVALVAPNDCHYLVAELAVLKLGAARVPLNELLSSSDIEYCLRDSGAIAAIGKAELLDKALAATQTQVGVIVDMESNPDRLQSDSRVRSWAAISEFGDPSPVLTECHAEDAALIMYTGGTTGRSKGVVHTQATLGSNLCSQIIETSIQEHDILLITTPLPHASGFFVNVALSQGACTLLHRGFDIDKVIAAIQHEGASVTFMVPTMIYRLLDALTQNPRDLSGLSTILYGAAPMAKDRLIQGLELLGPVFMQIYGQSEAPNFITRLTKRDHAQWAAHPERLKSCGQPVTMSRIRIVDDETGTTERAVGEVGEVTVFTPYTMRGYWNQPDQTAKALRGRWLHTGDLGYVDEYGFLYLVDRKNDMIISGGMNVYTTEVEGFLFTVEGVRSATVVGIPDNYWGEAVVAFIVPQDGYVSGDLNERILTRCKASLSKYKVPKKIEFLSELPVTPYGKVDKKRLRADYADVLSKSE